MLKEARKDKTGSVLRAFAPKILLAAIVILFAFLAWWCILLGNYYSRKDAVVTSFENFFLPARAWATENDKFTAREGELFYDAGDLEFGKARDIIRITQDTTNRDFVLISKKAIQYYNDALFVWTNIYESLDQNEAAHGLRRAMLLDSINHVLWRLAPFADKNEGKKDLYQAVQKNWTEALKSLEVYYEFSRDKQAVLLANQIRKNFEFFRKQMASKTKAGDSQNEANFNFPADERIKSLEGLVGKDAGERARVRIKIDQARKDAPPRGPQISGEGRVGDLKIDGVPGVGQLPLPVVAP